MGALPSFPGITIDAPTSKDLDDAIWLEPDGTGFVLYVSIANVAAAVPIGSPADLIAFERCFTRYYAEGNRTMLPRRLAEDELSLLPGTERNVVTVSIPISADGELGECTIQPAVLDNHGRFSYEDIAGLLDHGSGHTLYPMLQQARELANLRLDKRRASGALAFYDLRRGWETTEEGFYRKIPTNEANIGHIIVQEFMVATGTAVGTYMVQHGIEGLFRNHRASIFAPDRDQVVRDIANATVMPIKNLQALFARINLVMERATYGPTLQGHYGLNEPAYVHISSPIRRYADLIDHRQILAACQGDSLPYSRQDLEAIAEVINEIERQIKDAKHQAYKQQAQAEVEQALSSAELPELGANRFYDVLLQAAQQGALPPQLIAALDRRLNDESLGPRELFALLLVASPVPEIDSLRHRALDQLAGNPMLAPSILAMAGPILGWSVVRNKTRRHGKDHQPSYRTVATVNVPGHDKPLSSEQMEASSAKLAAHRAAVNLIGRYVGYQPLQSSSQPARAQAISTATTESTNHKGRLIELCQRQSWGRPEYQHTPDGPDHIREYTATVTVETDGAPVEATGRPAYSQQLAEHSAAEQLLAQLANRFGTVTAPAKPLAPSADNGQYVNAVQEICVAHGWPSPVYAFERRGNIYISRARLTRKGQPLLELAAHSTTKKEAKRLSALKLYRVLSKL